MKKWNCNIVANMYDRVIRRKFGLLCNDDTSNEDFINSYINRLDCTPINLQCVDSQPCDSITTITECNLVVTVTLQLEPTNSIYTFVPNVLNAVGTPTYNWTYNPLHWTFVSLINGILKLQPTVTNGSTITTIVSLVVEDERGCKGTFTTGEFQYLGGCTNPNAVNYNPNATFNNGTCYYVPLTLTTGYICNEEGNGDFCAVVTGGVPPYTLVGSPNGTILTSGGSLCVTIPNGGTYNLYAIDSLSNVTPVQSGTIVCPFNCESIIIKDNFNYVCLLDDLGNNTGQAQIFSTPSGGTSPYSVVISINGNPPIPFVNGSIVSNLDELDIYIIDANGCEYTSVPYVIDCPPPSPGGTFENCEELRDFLIENTTLQTTVAITNVVPSLAGPNLWTVFYTVGWNFISLAPPLTSANIANVNYSIENISSGNQFNFANYPTPGITPCNPCVANTYYALQASLSSEESWNCGSGLRSSDPMFVPPTNPSLYLHIDLNFTITVDDLVCNICASFNFNVEYDPCGDIFTPVFDSQNTIDFTICD